MAHRTRLSRLAPLALAAALPLGACVHHHHEHDGAPGARVVVQERGGPPPHAPAHGYRRKQHVQRGPDLELVFDSGLGVYVVVGTPDLYFFGDHYFRLGDAGWQISLQHDSGWTLAAQGQVPAGLWSAKGNGKNANGPKKGGPPGPAKRY
jgi:hypothetical protein